MRKYPHNNASNGFDEFLACFKMLSTFFDIPFKQNLLEKIIDDQLSSNNRKLLQPSQIASICELIGLKAIIKRVDL